MKNLFVHVLIAVLILGTTTACAQNRVVGSKKYITKDVNVESFQHIAILGSVNLIYTQTEGGKPQIEIYGSDNIVPLIETSVEHNTLTVKYKSNTSIQNPGKLEVRVAAPAVESMRITGSGDISIPNGLSTSDLTLKVTGSGDLYGKKITCNNLDVSVSGSGDIGLNNIKVTNVNATVSGSGDLQLDGTTVNASYRVSGSGDITAHKLVADDVEATVSGSGNVTCHAVKTLKGKVSGSGDVGYKGNPEISFSKKGLRKL
ncbi:head GIN domain-containing protein [Bacteroides sp. 51]|uniref:head GIN domain-containing protein n=1 Tax=Bacteroides sp. 51 TaxID=2302938 RepID=UPI0013CFC3D3|nr:head GIN domain-containing protein [Bacteroides sp. 51]NDV80455.1 DUF2807 domain-containing protein [Bacteroides sp. 51]